MKYIESGLTFEFDDTKWLSITQFDKETDYKKVSDNLKETKSVDFIGINNDIYFFEIKSFRGYADQKSVQERLANDAELLTTEIAQKVKDSVACLVAGARNSTNKSSDWKKLCNTIINTEKRVFIIAWIEEDIPPNKTLEKRGIVKRGTRQQKLGQKLVWLTKRVLILNVKNFNYNIDGLKVS